MDDEKKKELESAEEVAEVADSEAVESEQEAVETEQTEEVAEVAEAPVEEDKFADVYARLSALENTVSNLSNKFGDIIEAGGVITDGEPAMDDAAQMEEDEKAEVAEADRQYYEMQKMFLNGGN